MKSIYMMLIYVGTFIGLFLLLSLIGLFWAPYLEVLANNSWFFFYFVCIGWWAAVFPCMEYYAANKEYFDKTF